jgi:enamine deaminase RidA (YjgF/YER057c/UK114 family)
MSLLIPVAMLSAAPAGSAGATPVCKTIKGTLVYSPALPKLSTATKVNSTVVTAGKIGGCTGGGVTSAITASKSKYLGNCTSLLGAKVGSKTSGTETIIWSNGKSSTAATTLTSLNAVSAKGAHIKVSGKITKGQFPGLTFTVTINATAPAGSCVSKGLSTINFVNITGFTK